MNHILTKRLKRKTIGWNASTFSFYPNKRAE